jgi:hypothetical protein
MTTCPWRFSEHAQQRMIERDISYGQIAQALTDPITTYPVRDGATMHEGLDASVVISPDMTILSVYRRRFIRFSA